MQPIKTVEAGLGAGRETSLWTGLCGMGWKAAALGFAAVICSLRNQRFSRSNGLGGAVHLHAIGYKDTRDRILMWNWGRESPVRFLWKNIHGSIIGSE